MSNTFQQVVQDKMYINLPLNEVQDEEKYLSSMNNAFVYIHQKGRALQGT